MIFNFALCVAAGALRTIWTGFSWLYPNKTMSDINLITFQWIVFVGLIPNIYIVSLGDINNERGFKRFLMNSETNVKGRLILVFVCALNALTTGCIGCMEYAFGSLGWYEWMGYDISSHTGTTNGGLILFWLCLVIGIIFEYIFILYVSI